MAITQINPLVGTNSVWLWDVISEMSSDEELLLLSAGAWAVTISLVAFGI